MNFFRTIRSVFAAPKLPPCPTQDDNWYTMYGGRGYGSFRMQPGPPLRVELPDGMDLETAWTILLRCMAEAATLMTWNIGRLR